MDIRLVHFELDLEADVEMYLDIHLLAVVLQQN